MNSKRRFLIALIYGILLAVTAQNQSAAQSEPAPRSDTEKATTKRADPVVIASLIGARRRAIEKVLGKPLFPAQPEGRVNFQYGLTGSAEVWIIYLDDKPDSEMWSASVALLDGDVTWPDALRTIGYKVDGVRLVGKKLSHVKGAPKGFELLCTRHAIVIINEKKWLQYRQRHKKADKTQNWTSGRGVGLEIPTTRFVLEG